MKHVLLINSKEFPKCIRNFKELKGISIGKCIDPNWDLHGCSGHAHSQTGEYQGWICLTHKYQLKEKYTLLHEMAHLIANKSDKVAPHGKKWRNTLTAIGGTFKSFKNFNKTIIYDDFSPGKKK